MTHPAPIVQMYLTVQFQPAVHSLTIVDWADLRALFGEEFPIFTQVPRAGPMPADPTTMVVDMDSGLPRLQLTSKDLTKAILLQDDRLTVGWQRTESLWADPAYPGFDRIHDRLLSTLEIFRLFLVERAAESINLSVGEIVYDDAFLMHKDGAQLRRMEDVFNCVRSLDDFPMARFNLIYQRLLDPSTEGISGNVQTAITGLNGTPNNEALSHLQTTVRFNVIDDASGGISAAFRKAHDIARGIFQTLVKPDASAILAG